MKLFFIFLSQGNSEVLKAWLCGAEKTTIPSEFSLNWPNHQRKF
jgi:hypothetical protein